MKRLLTKITQKSKSLLNYLKRLFIEKIKNTNFAPEVVKLMAFFGSVVFIFSYLFANDVLISIVSSLVFILLSLQKIEATKTNPSPIGLLTLWGKKTKIIFHDGICFVPLFVGNLILEDGRIREMKFSIEDKNMYTPNDDTIIIFRSVLVVFRISNLSNYLNVSNVFEWISDKIKIALKDYISYNISGPKDWKSTRDVLNEKFTRIIVARLLGQEIPVYEKKKAIFKNGKLVVVKEKGEFKEEKDFSPEEKSNKDIVRTIVENMRKRAKEKKPSLFLDEVGVEILDIIVDPPDTTDNTKKIIEERAAEKRRIELEEAQREREELDIKTKISLSKKVKDELEINGSEAFQKILQITGVIPGNATNERIYRGLNNTGNIGIVELLKEEAAGGKK